jgi:Ribbon-helix-helix protein, copG family
MMLSAAVTIPQEATMTKARTATRTSLSLPRDLYERLQAEHARTGAPLAEIVRRAVDAYRTPREAAAKTARGR